MEYKRNTKGSAINDFKASFGGAWSDMSNAEKAKEWDNLMRLNQAIGRKTWVNPWAKLGGKR